jgi:hypothetical protein
MVNIISKRGIVFLMLFVALTLIGMEINFSPIIGMDEQFFTLFQFFGPIAGGFLGLFGIAAVLFAELINFVLVGKEVTVINLLRLTPMLFAAYYFSRNTKTGFSDRLSIVIPVLAMIAFWSTPGGMGAWYYALFWTVPLIAKFLPDMLFLRSLGATFTAHAVGASLTALAVPTMTAEVWTMLVPVTAFERALFAVGISASFVLFTNILNAADKVMNWNIDRFVKIDRRYVYA